MAVSISMVMALIKKFGGGGTGILSVKPHHQFLSTFERDDYFKSHDEELEEGIWVSCENDLYQYLNGKWENRTVAVVKEFDDKKINAQMQNLLKDNESLKDAFKNLSSNSENVNDDIEEIQTNIKKDKKEIKDKLDNIEKDVQTNKDDISDLIKDNKSQDGKIQSIEGKISNISGEKIKIDENDSSAGYLKEKIDNLTLEIKNNKLVATTLDGLNVTVGELNYMKGLDKNIKETLNNLVAGMSFEGVYQTYSDMIKILSTPLKGNMVIVKQDENNANREIMYIFDGTTWQIYGEFTFKYRDFTTEPLDLTKEVVGILDIKNLDTTKLKTLFATLDELSKVKSDIDKNLKNINKNATDLSDLKLELDKKVNIPKDYKNGGILTLNEKNETELKETLTGIQIALDNDRFTGNLKDKEFKNLEEFLTTIDSMFIGSGSINLTEEW